MNLLSKVSIFCILFHVGVAVQSGAQQWIQKGSPYLAGEAMQKLLHSAMEGDTKRLAYFEKPLGEERSFAHLAKELIPSAEQVSLGICGNQVVYALKNLPTAWASRMLDAFGKPQDGLLEGNIYWPGQFDECNSISSDGQGNLSFTGQYCKLSLPLSLGGQNANLQVGVCVPSGCAEQDVTALGHAVLTLLKHNDTHISTECHGPARSLNLGAIVAIIICSCITILLILGTAYDAFTNYVPYNKAVSSKESHSLTVNSSPEIKAGEEINGNEMNEKSPLIHPSGAASAKKAGLMSQVLIAFSFHSNGKKLFNTSQSEGSNLQCLNGVRFLSMCWVILGHTFIYSIADSDNPIWFLSHMVRRQSFQFMVNGTVCVDSFFLLSGLLVAYVLLNEMERKHGKLKPLEWVMIYVHRYIRLTAPYAIVLMIWTCLAVYFNDGPLWPTKGSLDPTCDRYWWTNLLYINNFVPGANAASLSCMGWSWYLANDMQFFLITPVIAWLIYRLKFAGIGVTALMILASIASSAVVSVQDNLQVGTYSAEIGPERNAWFSDYYTKPWARFSSYGIGILLGYFLHLRKGKVSHGVVFNVIGWMVAAACCLSVLYGPYEVQAGDRSGQATTFEAAAYNSLSRTVWAIGLAWVIYACSTNSGGWINEFLSWKPFAPLSRLTYCAYLIHPMMLIMAEYSARATFPYDDVTMILRFSGVLLCAMFLATVASLSFEVPLMNLEKLLLHPKKHRHQQ